MIFFPKFNPLPFRVDKYEDPTNRSDRFRYNPCRDNTIFAKTDFAVICFFWDDIHAKSGTVNLIDEYDNIIESQSFISETNKILYFRFSMDRPVGIYWIKIVSGLFTFYSEKIIITEDIKYTRLLQWATSRYWLGLPLKDGGQYVFSKRLDISDYNMLEIEGERTIFLTGWGTSEIVDSVVNNYFGLNIGYIRGLTKYVQELINYVFAFEYIALDFKRITVSDNTKIELKQADQFDDRKGISVTSLQWFTNVNNNVYTPAATTMQWILDDGSWNDSGFWLDGSIWSD